MYYMSTGIVYLAKNILSNKSYVGQTTRTLEIRKQQHLVNTIKKDYKFSRALRKYPESSWEWSILAEVPISELCDYERFFIKDLDSYKSGYNSNIGEVWKSPETPRRNNNVIYELWHPEHGEIKETLNDLCKRYSGFSDHIQELVRGKRQYINGYVLLKNKDRYKSIMRIHDFYHPEIGVITCTTTELFNKYRSYFKSGTNKLKDLASERILKHFGWVLAKNKSRYEDLVIDISEYQTLTHLEHGTLTLKRSEWKKQYGLSSSNLSMLKTKRIKSSKGWTL